MLRIKAEIKRMLGNEDGNRVKRSSSFQMRDFSQPVVVNSGGNSRGVLTSTINRPKNAFVVQNESFDLHEDGAAAAMKAYFDERCNMLKEKIELISAKTKKLDQSYSSISSSYENLTDEKNGRSSATSYQNKYNYRHEVNRRQHEFNSEFINLLNEALALVDGRPSRPLPPKLKIALTSLERRNKSFRHND